MSEEDTSARHAIVVVGGQALAVLAVALPAVGATVRLLGFSTRGVHDAAGVAIAASVPSLAMLGVLSALPGVILLAVMLPMMRATWTRRWAARELRTPGLSDERIAELRALFPPRRHRSSRRRWISPLVVMAALVLLFGPGFLPLLAAAVATPAAIVVGAGLVQREGKSTLGTVWPALLILLAGIVVAGALGAVRYESVMVTSTSSSVTSGEYIVLGRNDQFIYLRSCDTGHRQFEVRTDDIESIEHIDHPSRIRPPSLWQIIHGDGSISDIGAQLVCRAD